MIADCETETPIDAYAVALVETSNYSIDKADAPFIKAIRGMYLFDRNERVHCCELTPSFRLIHLYDQVECQPSTSEDRAQDIYEKYENQWGDDAYAHCRTIEALIANGDGPTVCHLGKPVYRNGQPMPAGEMSHEEQMEDLRETYTGNPPL